MKFTIYFDFHINTTQGTEYVVDSANSRKDVHKRITHPVRTIKNQQGRLVYSK